jgi:uncharacterized protein
MANTAISNRSPGVTVSRIKQVAERIILPIVALTPEMVGKGSVELTAEKRQMIIRALPGLVSAMRVFWTDGETGLFSTKPERARKVGRNEPCPCGSGKKYKRCCGALA